MDNDAYLYNVVITETNECFMLAPIKTIGSVFRLNKEVEQRIRDNPNGVILYGNGLHANILVKYACKLWQAVGEQ